ncbi:MAG: Mth938-like domain-containing protein [Gammaproteobacteria bacterium]
MQLTLDDKSSPLLIRGLGDGEIKIADDTYRSSVLITSQSVHDNWPVQSVADLTPELWTPILDDGAKILILGTGARIAFPRPEQTAPLTTRGVGVEVMDTAAACRTFNVLLSEGREVAAAIILTAA